MDRPNPTRSTTVGCGKRAMTPERVELPIEDNRTVKCPWLVVLREPDAGLASSLTRWTNRENIVSTSRQLVGRGYRYSLFAWEFISS